MLRKLLVVGVCAFFGNAISAVAAECNCKVIAESKQGFCEACNKGEIFGEKLTSRKLYEVLNGQSVETAKISCDGCKRAAEKNDNCALCKVGYAAERMYHSPIAHSVALGTPYSAEKASGCNECRKAFVENSFCSACNVGFVNGRLHRTRNQHARAVDANEIIRNAITISKTCEDCAVAMVTNAKCEKCNVRFQNGHSLNKKRDNKENEEKPNAHHPD